MPTLTFDSAATDRAMRLSIWEGMCFSVMTAFGEAYFVADAVRLGAPAAKVGLLVALPLLVGSIGAVLVPRLLVAVGRRKPVVLAAVTLQIGVLASIAAAEWGRTLTADALLALACVYQALGQAAGVAWGSWYGDVVPAAVRGRYFARRSRFAYISMFASFIAAGATLQALEPSAAGIAAGTGGRGYATVFTVAVLARVACLALLSRSPEPTFGGIADARDAVRSIAGADGGIMRRVIASACLLQLAVTIGSPYFSPFMLGELHLSYAQYTAGTLVVVATKLATLPGWGRRIDRLGARAVVIGAAILIATVPFPWLFARGFGVVVLAQALSGLAWGGYEVSQYTLLLDSADARRRPALLAVVNVLNGLAQLGGTLIGAAALAFGGGDYRAVFLTTFVARLTAAASMWFILPAHGLGGHLRASRLRLRLFGWSAATGPMLRPMPRDAEASGFVDTTELAGEADARRD